MIDQDATSRDIGLKANRSSEWKKVSYVSASRIEQPLIRQLLLDHEGTCSGCSFDFN